MILIPSEEALNARAKMKHIKLTVDITDADMLEPFILDSEDAVICPNAQTGQIACDATQQGYLVCPSGVPYTAPQCPAP